MKLLVKMIEKHVPDFIVIGDCYGLTFIEQNACVLLAPSEQQMIGDHLSTVEDVHGISPLCVVIDSETNTPVYTPREHLEELPEGWRQVLALNPEWPCDPYRKYPKER